uniref:Metastasis associated 1 n=1 Tax=Sus scrofa TaxID=9823 RepID=A0A4X1U1V9_PIG
MAANMYRVGDYVYFENSSSNPYLIRRIEELNKTASGNVEAKVVCFYRRRDISSSLVALADKHAREVEEEVENPEMVDLPEKLKHQLRHRELFLSRQLESLPATHIRGKCSVTLLNETESLKSYLEREDFFFYSLVYDPQQKTLLADKGEIRVGNRYQADITDLLKEGEEDGRDQSKLETKVWEAHNPLVDKQIDQFLVVARSVGTFARALDCSSSVRQPSLHMSAAAASRDITLFHAMDTLHRSVYDVAKAISALVPQGGPVLCRDEMEEWSASEASLFEEALEKYGKDFTDIQQDFLPWKSLTSIIEYYYMWKTTDRYVQQKRLKAAEAESKLKQVYIPNYNKPNPNQISVNSIKAGVVNGGAPGQSPGAGRACESCYTTQSYQWYSWGPPNMQCRLCASCWTYWKKYGGLKMPTRLDGERPGPNRSNMSPHGIPARSSGSPKFAMKTRQAFYLHTTKLTRIARRLCREILRPWHAARHPYMPINSAAIKAECTARLPEAAQSPLVLKQAVRKPLEAVLRYLETHPRPPKPDPVKNVSGVLSGLAPAKSAPVINNGSPTILGKRSYEQHNGVDGNVKKRLLMPSRGTYLGLANHGQTRHMGPSRNLLLNGKAYPTKVRLIRGGSLPPVKRRRMNWIDAPDDVFYMATEETRCGPRGRGGAGAPRPRRSRRSPSPAAPLTGRSASCSRPRRPSARPAGPTSPSPCARARPCRCGRRRPRPSTTSPSSSRTRRRRRRPLAAARTTGRAPAAARPPARPPARRPVLVVPLPALTCRETAPRLGEPGSRRGPSPGAPARPPRGRFFSFVFTFWPERSRGAAPSACSPLGLVGRPGVLLCSVEGAILNFIFITFFVDELKLCNLHPEC